MCEVVEFEMFKGFFGVENEEVNKPVEVSSEGEIVNVVGKSFQLRHTA